MECEPRETCPTEETRLAGDCAPTQKMRSVTDGDDITEESSDEVHGSREDTSLPTDIDARDTMDDELPLTFEERCGALLDLVGRQSEHREIFVDVLGFCAEAQEESRVEERIAARPEFAYETQSPYYLIAALVKAGGLERFELDEQGEVVTPERRRGLSEDEIDDLVWSVVYQTTDVGMTVAQDMQPGRRLDALLAARPTRRDTYCEVLEFCCEPRTRRELEELLEGRPILVEEAVGHEPLKPSVFIDKLERSGALVWNGTWNTSAAAQAYLEALAL